jgi:hypothetical protein
VIHQIRAEAMDRDACLGQGVTGLILSKARHGNHGITYPTVQAIPSPSASQCGDRFVEVLLGSGFLATAVAFELPNRLGGGCAPPWHPCTPQPWYHSPACRFVAAIFRPAFGT